jgi:hypothetical protein
MDCLQPCGPYYNPEGDLCGLEEGHEGPCDPTYRPRLPEFMKEAQA